VKIIFPVGVLVSTFSERDTSLPLVFVPLMSADIAVPAATGLSRGSTLGFHSVWVLDEIRVAGEGANDRAPLPLCSTRFDSRLCDQESGGQ
jgi:hypothetical protein